MFFYFFILHFYFLLCFIWSKVLPLKELFIGSRAVAFCSGAALGQVFRRANLNLSVVTVFSNGPNIRWLNMPKEGMIRAPHQSPRFLLLKVESSDQQHQQSPESLFKMQY